MELNNLPKYTFDWKGGFALFLGAMLPSFLLASVHVFSIFFLKENYQYNDFFLLISNVLLWFGAIWAFDYFCCRPETGKKLNFNFSLKDFSTYLLIFPMMLGVMFVAEFMTNQIPISGPVFGYLYKIFTEMMAEMTSDTSVMIMLAVIMAPIFEEIVFRGIIQKGMINKGMNPNSAIWISALIFGLVHGNPWQFVGAVLLGYVLGIVYYKTQSLLLPMLLHGFNNLCSALLIKYYGIESFSESFNISEYALLGIGIVLFGVFYFLFLKKYADQPAESI